MCLLSLCVAKNFVTNGLHATFSVRVKRFSKFKIFFELRGRVPNTTRGAGGCATKAPLTLQNIVD